MTVSSFASVMRRAHSSRSWVRFWRRCATSWRSNSAIVWVVGAFLACVLALLTGYLLDQNALAPSEQLPSLSKSYLPLPPSSACKFKPEVPQAEGMNLTTGNPVRPDTTRSMPGWHQVAHNPAQERCTRHAILPAQRTAASNRSLGFA